MPDVLIGKENLDTDTHTHGSKITVDRDCSHEMKRRLLLGRKARTNLDNTLKSRTSFCQQRYRYAKLWFFLLGVPGGSAGKESTCNAGDLGLVPGLGRSPGEGNGYPLQCSGLENAMDCIVHGVAKSWTRLSDFHFHTFHLMYWCKSWTIKKAECQRTDGFELCWRRLLRVLWKARRPNQSILKEIKPEYSLKD